MTSAEWIIQNGGRWPEVLETPNKVAPKVQDFIDDWRTENPWVTICEECPHLVLKSLVGLGGQCEVLSKMPEYQGCGCQGQLTGLARKGKKCPIGKHDS